MAEFYPDFIKNLPQADVPVAGVDAVSVGALTHSAPAIDVALELTPI